jgi:anti-sigma regulatory factor (Ser/Thr protein kinase)
VSSIARRAPRRLASFAVASVPGNERVALAHVAESVAGLGLPPARLDKLKTAVAEATMNAMEHGNGHRPELAVDIEVFQSGAEVIVTITDRGGRDGGGGPRDRPGAPERPQWPERPDLRRKLNGEEGPRGWGLFLIRHMVDAMDVTTEGDRHTVRLSMRTG